VIQVFGRDLLLGLARILKDQLKFENSRDSLGLQLADMLATILRRALNNRLQYSGWKDFGGLLVRHKDLGHGFIAVGPGPETALSGHAKRVCQILNARARNMFVDDENTSHLNVGTPTCLRHTEQ
jgi:hypothetical protein